MTGSSSPRLKDDPIWKSKRVAAVNERVRERWPERIKLCSVSYSLSILSPGEIAQVKAEIQRLEQFHKECDDSRIQEVIEAWIATAKKKLTTGINASDSHHAG
jgi:hypothetical protein